MSDLTTGLTVWSSEVIWDTSKGTGAPGNLTSGWAGYSVEKKSL